ncbi:MAG: CTP synthase [Candidatus Harrisonbacteria bacterium CG10_big_fil_rev_8_21_14_0_10_42_17]|uniref:CTP synthase (glutamine hydrolyzing) n=1 Tax=Candidatus Harrisonbacteria bacterium CG10_big_fil_rev_8_21_14_0_10_42_17 TaxID=1974584 RepID=A0A2M6WJB8_9BACT|nr:MAG: CTP synthase [Candidatus Harrisonbacteria bacterium CG10_big_fil_rev_8_21_14_0_10_42_17]
MAHKTPVKYIFVSGGVISGLGKGITTASLGLLLKAAGYRVTLVKFENYLNLDAGIINPIEHGDVFLCEDGAETDMDIGTYEKFLNQNMGRHNFVTMGQVYKTVIERERSFGYHGEDVEAIPHITDEIIGRIKQVVKKDGAEIALIELGGTAGEYQNVLYYEASRILTLKNPGDVVHVHVSYVPTPGHLGEPKTKPTQLSVRTLNSMGIQPDFIVTRSERPLDRRRKDRFAVFCNIPSDHIIASPDAGSVYEVPIQFEKQKFHQRVMRALGLSERKSDLASWKAFLRKVRAPKKTSLTIAIVGKYFSTGEYHLRDSYAALFDALDHASWALGVELNTQWIDSGDITSQNIEKLIGRPDGIVVPIGWGIRGAEGMIEAADYARKKKIPYLGLCYGMQLAVVSYARHVLRWSDADTEENNQSTKHSVVHVIPAQEELIKRRAYGGTMRLGAWDAVVKPDTIAYGLYDAYDGFINKKKRLTSERHRHRYELNDAFAEALERKGLVISARSAVEGLAEIIELPRNIHPFYLGTQGHPEYKSRPLKPHPLFMGFLDAAKKQKKTA